MENVNPSFENIIPKLITLSEQAGALIAHLYKKAEGLKIISKEDGSPVTEADHQSHHLLAQGLKELTPHIPIISEEDEESWGIKSPFHWLIDPLDGTRGFIGRDGQFCINIALMKDDKAILGLIHLPLTGETFYGYENTAVKHTSGQSTLIHTRPCPPKESTLLLSNHDLKCKEKWEKYIKDFPHPILKPLHSAIKFCRIAEGAADIYLRFVPCKEWDTAAGQILVEAAGGTMETLEGTPFLYGKPNLKNPGFKVLGQKP